MKNLFVSSLLLSGASAFPFVLDAPGVDSSMLRNHRRQQPGEGAGGEAACPFNPNHVPAAPVTAQFPYNNAKNGQQGNGKGGYLIPDPRDKAHQFQKPNPKTDIRGPCPGLNTAANHGFLARDGITTFSELVDAQQNVYNVGYDLANTLAILGLTLTDGDPVTQKLSIGCDATSRTSYNQVLTGHEPGLDGHNKFEGDTSLSRNDFFLNKGNDFTFNGTLFGMMTDTTGGNYNLQGLGLYRYQRYQQSRADNPNFFYGPLSLLLYGAASFLYELMPSANQGMVPNIPNISSFFGTKKNANGQWIFLNEERIPPNWTPRISPYTNNDVTNQILAMYELHPVLFGGNTGNGGFDTINFGAIRNGKLAPANPTETSCLLYQLATGSVPSSLNSVITPSVAALSLVASKLTPLFANLGCPIPET